MSNLKLKPEQRLKQQPNPGLRRKLTRLLEDAGRAFDRTYSDEQADQGLIAKLRQRSRSLALKVLAKQPDNIDALNLLGRIALDEGDIATATKFLDQGLALEPDSAALSYSRGHVHLSQHEYDLGIKLFLHAESVAPQATRARAAIAFTKEKQGKYVEAFDEYRLLIKRDPTDPHIKARLFECLQHIQVDYYSTDLEAELITYLDLSEVDHDDLSNIIASLLIHKYDLVLGNSALDPELLSSDVLLNKALRLCQFSNSVIEEFLTACRQCILQESINRQQIDSRFMEFLVSISLQCVNNEFVYAVSLTEEKVLTELQSIVMQTVVAPDWQTQEVEYPLLLLSMYALLHHGSFRIHLLRKPISAWSNPMQWVIQPHLYEPQKELEIKRTIEKLSNVQHPASVAVSKQYEESPYPRWSAVSHTTKTDYGQALSAELAGFSAPSFLRNQTLKILIAGCGTGRHAVAAAKSFRNVELTAIDLSRSSLAYATKMAKRHDVSNIEFFQADILELDSWKEKFHIIECSGVLHHMQAPLTGWQNLISLLEPGGLIKVGLYSERARQVVSTARQIIVENQMTATDEHIRIFRQALFDDLIDGDFTTLKKSADFYNLSGCRDLLFHVQEHLFTPLTIEQALEQLKLEFLGFVNLPNQTKQDFDNKFPKDKTRTNLKNWDIFEQQYPETFNSMFQFYCQVKPRDIAKIR